MQNKSNTRPRYHLCAVIARALFAFPLALTSSCVTTSLSDPTGSDSRQDLDSYEVTGMSASPTEAEIRRASLGGLPSAGSRILLVQSGALQPDAELIAAYQPYCQVVPWTGRRSQHEEYSSEAKTPPGAIGKKLRLIAAQQSCSHVILVQGQIAKDGEDLPVVSWVPVANELLPTRYSGMRLQAQAIILETLSGRSRIVSAPAEETRGLEMGFGIVGNATDRSLKLKGRTYPRLASACFGG
jgi:hypothetical protein